MSVYEQMVGDTIKIIEDMFFNDEVINKTTVSKKADVSRTFLYSHLDIIKLIDKYEKYQSADFDAQVIMLTNDNKELLARLEAYDKQILNNLDNC